ncbi:MAG: DUF1697 domain-containing protein [Anaerolineales bacterium]|nr:DUF1697 domain-containing protein [Anaerolineales bacterium]
MATFIALLRGINVGGNRKILMADLRQMCAGLGLRGVATYVQSGNVVFESDDSDPVAVVARLEAAILAMTGFEVAVVVRTSADLRRILALEPYPNGEPKFVHVLFLREEAGETAVSTFTPPPGNSDEYRIDGHEIYIHYLNGAGQSKLTGNYFERKLGVVGTARNWRTVQALLALAEKPRK